MLHSCVPLVPVCQPCKQHIRLSDVYPDVNLMFTVSCGHPWKGMLQHAPQLCPTHTRMPRCNLPREDRCMHLSALLDTSHLNGCFKGLQSSMDLLYRSTHYALMRPRCTMCAVSRNRLRSIRYHAMVLMLGPAVTCLMWSFS